MGWQCYWVYGVLQDLPSLIEVAVTAVATSIVDALQALLVHVEVLYMYVVPSPIILQISKKVHLLHERKLKLES
jgi:hypothetical protein